MIKKVIVPLNVSDTEDEIEIITIKVSPNEELLAILAGKNLIKEIEELHQLFIYRLSPEENDYTLRFKIDLKVEHRFFSKSFEFVNDNQFN